MRRLRTAGHGLAVVATTGLMIAAIVLSLLQLVGVFRIVPVLSGSMSGYVETGDAVVLRPVPTADLAVDDVIAFHPPVEGSPLTLHRVVEREDLEGRVAVRTRGDANPAVDPWLAQLEGDTAWRSNGIVLAGAGRPVLWLQRPLVRLVWLAVTLGIVLAVVLRRIWRVEGAPQSSVEGPVVRGRGAPALAVTVLLLVAMLAARQVPAASAALTATVSASQSVTSWSDLPSGPTSLRVELLCELGEPTGVFLQWEPSPAPDLVGYEILRGPTATSNMKTIARVDATTTQYVDTALKTVLSGDAWYRVRGVTSSGETLPTEAVSLLAICPTATDLADGTREARQ